MNPSSFAITNAYTLLQIIAALLAALSIGKKTKLPSNSFKLAITSQSLSAELTSLGIILVLRLLILSSMAEIILFFHSRKLQMLMPLLEKSCAINSFRPVATYVLDSCQDILTSSLYLGPLETSFKSSIKILFREQQVIVQLMY